MSAIAKVVQKNPSGAALRICFSICLRFVHIEQSFVFTTWGFLPHVTLLLAGYPASLGPSLSVSLPANPYLPPTPLPLSILALPGFAQNMCLFGQDNCIPEILFTTWCFKLLQHVDL